MVNGKSKQNLWLILRVRKIMLCWCAKHLKLLFCSYIQRTRINDLSLTSKSQFKRKTCVLFSGWACRWHNVVVVVGIRVHFRIEQLLRIAQTNLTFFSIKANVKSTNSSQALNFTLKLTKTLHSMSAALFIIIITRQRQQQQHGYQLNAKPEIATKRAQSIRWPSLKVTSTELPHDSSVQGSTLCSVSRSDACKLMKRASASKQNVFAKLLFAPVCGGGGGGG